MKEQSLIEQAPRLRCVRRWPLWPLLLLGVLWALVSVGCITANFVTDVIHNANGYGAVASIELEYDAGVYAALQKLDPTITNELLPADPVNGWVVKRAMEGRKVIMRRSFDSLQALQTLPTLLAGDSGDATDSFVRSIAVTAQQINSMTVQYQYTATVVIPAHEPASAEDANANETFDLNSLLEDEKYHELKAALDQAGAGEIVVQVYLPGEIKQQSVNGQPGGDFQGGRVRWVFTDETPGSYELRVISEGPTALAVEHSLLDVFAPSEHLEKFLEVVGEDHWMHLGAELAAIDALQALRGPQAQQAPVSEIKNRKEAMLAQAVYLASHCQDDGQKKQCLMPSLYRALPLIKRLTHQIGDDEEALSALSVLVTQLVEHDLEKLSDTVAKVGP